MAGKHTPVNEAKKVVHPNQQKIDVHEPEKDEITAKDFEMLRAGKKAKMKEETEVEEAANPAQQAAVAISLIKAGKKKGTMPKPMKEELEELEELKKSTVGSYISKKFGKMSDEPASKNPNEIFAKKDVKGIQRAGLRMSGMKATQKESIDYSDDVDETIYVHTPIEFEIAENFVFGDYLTAAKNIIGEEKAIELANYAFKNQDTDIFVEEFMRSDIEAKVKAHKDMGHKVSEPKYSTKSGMSHAEYIVTDKEGMRRKYIHHGSNRKTENLGHVGKRDEE